MPRFIFLSLQTVRRFSLVALILMIASPGLACRRADPRTGPEITVSAAVSLKDAFREIARQYEERAGAKINFNFGASGALQKQIEAGAPADVFACAGIPQMDALAKQGLIAPETRRDFARNTLVLIVPDDSKPGITSFADLADPRGSKASKLAIGNPKTVPVGQYAEQTLTRLGLWEKLKPELILAEDARQALDYVARGEVDAGIVYASDVRATGDRTRIIATAPEGSHDPVLYPIAVVRESGRREEAKTFIDAVMSDDGQRILEKYGFNRVH